MHNNFAIYFWVDSFPFLLPKQSGPFPDRKRDLQISTHAFVALFLWHRYCQILLQPETLSCNLGRFFFFTQLSRNPCFSILTTCDPYFFGLFYLTPIIYYPKQMILGPPLSYSDMLSCQSILDTGNIPKVSSLLKRIANHKFSDVPAPKLLVRKLEIALSTSWKQGYHKIFKLINLQATE